MSEVLVNLTDASVDRNTPRAFKNEATPCMGFVSRTRFGKLLLVDEDTVRMVASVRPPSIEWAVISVAVTLVVVFAVSAFVIGFDALMSSLRKFDSITIGFFFCC